MTTLDNFDGLLNWPRLQSWIDAHDLPGYGAVTDVKKLAGGTQNNVFSIHRGPDRFVLRRPPRHLRANSNATMMREARVLRALSHCEVPHPRFYAACDDEAVIGACFYTMAALDGVTMWGSLPGRYGEDVDWRGAMGSALVRAAAALANVDYKKAGLSDLGKPEDWHVRQTPRWLSQLDGYRKLANYEGHDLPHVDEIAEWLGSTLPADKRIGVIHGDLNICNAMFSLDEPRIEGIIDWELATLGDPMLDLGWLLASWVEADDPPGQAPLVQPWDGFGSRDALVVEYCTLTGRDPAAATWYFALACFKLACILEGNYARARAGQASIEIGDRHHARARWLLTKAKQLKDSQA